MPGSGFVAAVRAVDWSGLPSTYESGEVVRDIVLRLGSHDEAEVEWAWEQIGETVLQHQGTVYPATAAAPFLCQLAMEEATPWRATLTAKLAFLSVGYDEPFAPAGTARAVREAVRSHVGQLLSLWGTADLGLDVALVAVSVAFPEAAAVVTPQVRDWFGRSGPPLRAALGLALAVHGLADDAVRQVVLDEAGQSIRWATRRGGLIGFAPSGTVFPEPDQEPYIDSPVLKAIQVAERLRSGTDEQSDGFTDLYSLLMTTFMDYVGHLIDGPPRR
jgi:hypothetical protein